jgi:hypothetical protein
MEAALRIALVTAVVACALWVPRFLEEDGVDEELTRLEGEVAVLHDANDRLRRDNESHRTLVRGLREDLRVMDRRAREALNVSREGELILWFEADRTASLTPR